MQIKVLELCQIKESEIKNTIGHVIDKEYPEEKNTNSLIQDLMDATKGSECP